MKIGVLDGVLQREGEHKPWADLYIMAAELGFDGMELGVFDKYETSDLWHAEGRKRLFASASKTGIATPSICLHSYWKWSFASPDPDLRKTAHSIAEVGARAAAEIGASNILVPLTCPAEVEDEVARQRWIEGMKAVARAAESAGVCFCLENVNKQFADAPEDILTVVKAIDSPAVQVYYDPGNAVHSGRDPIEGVRLLGKRIRQIHVKEIGGTYLGDGTVPWPGILKALREVGYDGWFVLETTSTDKPAEAAKRNTKALKAFSEEAKA